MTFPPENSLVKCDWVDIVMVSGWQDKGKIGEISAPHAVTSLGWLSHIGEDYVIISSTVSTNDPDQYNNHASIPVGCIKNLQEFTI